MPSINGLPLPTITVHSEVDLDELSAKLADMKMPVEAMVEVAIFCKRQREKAEVLSTIEAVMRGRIDAIYEKVPESDRDTTRTGVGMVTYTAAGEKVAIKDRDFTVENLTAEQIRIAFDPSAKAVKALETILKPDEFNRHVKRTPTPSKTTLRDIPQSDKFEELDF